VSLYLLDTNIVSRMVRGRAPHLTRRLENDPIPDICVSIVSRAEILFGLARIGNPPRLSLSITSFFENAQTFNWDESAAQAYARLRTDLELQGISVAPIDLMIASHAHALGAVLVTNDSALKRLGHLLSVEDWTE
jgi:tRNA(fMet)-specific endonuclease VapC